MRVGPESLRRESSGTIQADVEASVALFSEAITAALPIAFFWRGTLAHAEQLDPVPLPEVTKLENLSLLKSLPRICLS